MLNLATFPSLEKFGYYSGSSTLFPNNAIPSIFNRSRCQLTHFDLCGDLEDGTTDGLISILSDLPTITHFKLQEEDVLSVCIFGKIAFSGARESQTTRSEE